MFKHCNVNDFRVSRKVGFVSYNIFDTTHFGEYFGYLWFCKERLVDKPIVIFITVIIAVFDTADDAVAIIVGAIRKIKNLFK